MSSTEWKISLEFVSDDECGPPTKVDISMTGSWQEGNIKPDQCLALSLGSILKMVIASGQIIGGGSEIEELVSSFEDAWH